MRRVTPVHTFHREGMENMEDPQPEETFTCEAATSCGGELSTANDSCDVQSRDTSTEPNYSYPTHEGKGFKDQDIYRSVDFQAKNQKLYLHKKTETQTFQTNDNVTNEINALYKNLERFGIKMGIVERPCKLTINDVLAIGPSCTDNQALNEDIICCFLQKLMSLNASARNTTLQESIEVRVSNVIDITDISLSSSIHPLDIICILLHSSDNFLQQEIFSKMYMCQFAVPLLLPAGDQTNSAFMLWAMRDIVIKWISHSSNGIKTPKEDNVVNIQMPTFSFVRLGESSFSKSAILNTLLSPSSHSEIFVHHEMDGGDKPKTIANGLVEMFWYFPGKQQSLVSTSGPFAVTNLHGDIRDHEKQFRFIAEISSVVFIFIKDSTDADFTLISSCTNAHFFVIVEASTKEKSSQLLQTLETFPNIIQQIRCNSSDKSQLLKNLRFQVIHFIKTTKKHMCLIDMASTAVNYDIEVDEYNGPCQIGNEHAKSITSHIQNISQYKSSTLKLQGALWKDISKTDKELCRQKHRGDTDDTVYKNSLMKKRLEMHRTQYQQAVPQDIILFIQAMELDLTEKHYFLKWMKFYLDSLARKNLSVLHAKFKEKQKDFNKELDTLCQEISDSSLGVEHFLRELGQYYEAECSLVTKGEVQMTQRKFTDLPGTAADLLLNGFPLELIDGDASNIPLQWITGVLLELDKKTGGQCRLRVITVLGVQSTGKSTLLNTMFGLQFPVASGRCTRGAFMTLIKVKENLQEQIGCEFILVIDTEGLKAPELSSLDDSYEHDNELATLVVGLSDITIVNVSMENTSEMKDILTIVLHAFLRMSSVDKKPNCQFVHQNVSDVSTDDYVMIGRAQFFNELQEMLKVAAKLEKKETSVQFADILDYDPQKHSWYIPGLWQGAPPMASVNVGYSENVFELKKYVLEFMTEKHDAGIHSIRSFAKWINTLWKAIKYESFIFSFRNILAAEAYEQLSKKYSDLEWGFRKKIYKLISESENSIKNEPIENHQQGEFEEMLNKSMGVIDQEEKHMTHQLLAFFKSGSNNPHLIEKYRQEFINSVKGLKLEMQNLISSKLIEAISIQKGKHNLQTIKQKYLQIVDNQLNNHKEKLVGLLDEQEQNKAFESIWQSIIRDLEPYSIEKLNIGNKMLEQLKSEMRNTGSNVNEMLKNVMSLQEYKNKSFYVKEKHMNSNIVMKVINFFSGNTARLKLQSSVFVIQDICQEYVVRKVETREDYSDLYCRDLLNMINDYLEKHSRKLSYNHLFQVELKLHILGKSAPQFQHMHDIYVVDNDPIDHIKKLKVQYFKTFKSKIRHINETMTRAKNFCEWGLKPAITAYVYNNLGRQIIDDIRKDSDGAIFKSRRLFQYHVLAELLETNSFQEYNMYINKYRTYIKRYIYNFILHKYRNSDVLSTLVDKNLSAVFRKIRQSITDEKAQNCESISKFLRNVSSDLKQYLVIPRTEIKMTPSQNKANVSQFCADIQSLLSDLQNQVRSNLKTNSITFLLCNLSLQPDTALTAKIIGCEQECPFCHAVCEAESVNHTEHFATCHRPSGIAQYTRPETNSLCTSICTSNVVSNHTFCSNDTKGQWIPYKNYRMVYPDWIIENDKKTNSSEYWKFVFTRFNSKFAELYNVEPAEIPAEWYKITKKHALRNLKAAYNIE